MSLLLAQSGHPDMLNQCAFGGKADMRLTGIRHGLMPSPAVASFQKNKNAKLANVPIAMPPWPQAPRRSRRKWSTNSPSTGHTIIRRRRLLSASRRRICLRGFDVDHQSCNCAGRQSRLLSLYGCLSSQSFTACCLVCGDYQLFLRSYSNM
jgi:hypothetical protein